MLVTVVVEKKFVVPFTCTKLFFFLGIIRLSLRFINVNMT